MNTLENTTSTCANCGKEGSEVTNTCNKCKMVMYCNAACKKRHRHKHKKECEEHLRKAAEHAAKLHDEKLFKQPPPLEDCPICMIQLPTLDTGRTYNSCCGKTICSGCIHAVYSTAVLKSKSNPVPLCPFCRVPSPTTDEHIIKRYKKRLELNDAEAISNMGNYYFYGRHGLSRSYAKALELWHRAAELGNAEAYCNIGYAYKFGRGVEIDEKKAVHYWDLGALGGDEKARSKLGVIEVWAGKYDRALKHWMIGAKSGNSDSLKCIKKSYVDGHASKDDYAAALHSYQAYVDEIKSDQRDEAAAFDNDWKYYDSAFYKRIPIELLVLSIQ